MSDFNIEKLLGTGAFAQVHLASPAVDSIRKGSGRLGLSADSKYAIKRVLRKGANSDGHLDVACHGIVTEASILMKLPRHDNIILIHGVSKDFFIRPESGFIILQLLETTLDKKIEQWNTEPHNKRLAKARCSRKYLEHQQLRMQDVGFGIVKAVAFLHRHGIIYRDLKPANIGLDSNGQVRLFDFGLAKYHEKRNKILPERRHTTFVGSPRYMSPEVATSGNAYDLAADIYSLAVLLWQVCTLETPYAHAKCIRELRKTVFNNNRRPSLRLVHQKYQGLIKSAWNPNAELRPSATDILNQLTTEPQKDTTTIRTISLSSDFCTPEECTMAEGSEELI